MVESVPYDECRHLYPAVGERYYHTVATQSLVVQEAPCIMIETKKGITHEKVTPLIKEVRAADVQL